MRQFELWLRNPWVIALPMVMIIFVSIFYSFGAGLNLEEGRNLALILGGLVALPLAGWRSWLAAKQVALSEAGHNTDRYQKGAAMLGDARLSVRQAGIFGLTELAENNLGPYFSTVTKLLCSYIKDRLQEQKKDMALRTEGSQEGDEDQTEFPADCQTAVMALSDLKAISRTQRMDRLFGMVDLRRVDFTGADLSHSNLADVYMPGATLTMVNLAESDLSGSYMTGCDLKGAVLRGADLTETDLSGADLTGADLVGANFTRTRIEWAKGLRVRQLERARNVDKNYLEELRRVEKEEQKHD